ncbi:MAG: class I SAM-dependent methyltransferase [Vulcanimicrobiaceae bacterium]
MNNELRYSADEFEREARYIENLVWDALVVTPGDRVLFCGYGPDGKWVKRAIDAGAAVSVIEHRDEVIRTFASLGATLVRGSTSVIPAKENAFELAVSFHYLHETDPFFHAQIVSELSRVAKRVAIVEPSPPADPLGKRISLLYSQAKRELGQFEYYQPLEYWKKLLQAVKADVSQHVFAFAKVPPREYLIDTIDLILRTMEVEDVPKDYLDELRQIAKRSDVQLLPPARYILVGAAVGNLIQPVFTPREEPSPTPRIAQIAQRAQAQPAPAVTPPAAPVVSEATGYEFPPVDPPVQAPQGPSFWSPASTPAPPIEPPPAFAPGLPFGAPPPPVPPPVSPQAPAVTPFGAPFAVPGVDPMPFGMPPPQMPGPSWHWEPPDSTETNPES